MRLIDYLFFGNGDCWYWYDGNRIPYGPMIYGGNDYGNGYSFGGNAYGGNGGVSGFYELYLVGPFTLDSVNMEIEYLGALTNEISRFNI